jgi:hypothetical protein
MKKTSKKSNAPRTKQPRPIDDGVLADARGGADGDPVPPWEPEQHNEATVRARPRQRRARR